MTMSHDFKEWGRARTILLSPFEAGVLNRHSYAVSCEDRGSGRFRVGPIAGFVGSVQLSAQTSLTVEPRMPLSSFASLLALAYDEQAIPMRNDNARVGVGDITSWSIAQIVAEAQKLFATGIKRDYVSIQEYRTSPRGRLRFSGSSPRYDGALLCTADDFILDTPINRFVKSGLRNLLSRDIARPWHKPIRQLLSDFSGVSDLRIVDIPHVTSSQPLYYSYRPLISLLKLIQRAQGSEFETGSIEVSAFFFRLHELFERAIYNAFRRQSRSLVVYQPPLRGVAIHVAGQPDLGITFRPDTAIKSPTVAIAEQSGKWRLVIDAKYRNPIAFGQYRRAFRNENLYQILAYSRAFGCPGLLIYPRVDQDVDITYRVGEASIRIVTVDLSAPNFVAAMHNLVADVLATA